MTIGDKFFPVSWDQFHRDARALAQRLNGSAFSKIVAVARGGLAPAAIVARELSLRVVETICVASYSESASGVQDAPGRVLLLKDLGDLENVGGAGALIVDDLADSGATIQFLRASLPNAHYATLYVKPLGAPFVDTFVTEVSQDTWIHFPWDLGLAFQPPLSRDSRL